MKHRSNNQVYEVQAILDEAILNCQMHYLIKWKNFGHESDTWEPVSSLKNIQSYLQFWVRQRRLTNEKKKSQKTDNFKSIKSYLYNGEFLSKKKGKYAKYQEEILTKKKTWQKYLEKNDQVIDVEEEPEGQQEEFLRKNQERINEILNDNSKRTSNKEEEFFDDDDEEAETSCQANDTNNIKEEQKINENNDKLWTIDRNAKQTTKIEAKEDKNENLLESTQQKQVKKSQKKKKSTDDDKFEVVGSINMKDIVKVVRVFTRGSTKILQIKMKDGKVHFAKEEDVAKINPEKLLQFYEDEDLKF